MVLFAVLLQCTAVVTEGYIQVGDCEAECYCVDSEVLYESDGRIGVGRTSMDADLHVGGTAAFDRAVKFGHNSHMARATFASGYGTDASARVLYAERFAETVVDAETAYVFKDKGEGSGTTMLVGKHAGDGTVLQVQRRSGVETTLAIATTPEVELGRSVWVQHRGHGIGMTFQNDATGCFDADGEPVDCLIHDESGHRRNPTAVVFPGGELAEWRCASDNTCFDVFAGNTGNVYSVHVVDVPGDSGAIYRVDYEGTAKDYVAYLDSGAGTIHLRVSKEFVRVGGGTRMILSSAPDPGGAHELLHVQDGNVLIETGNLTVSDGYIKFGRTYRQPPDDDCAVQADIGKTKVEADEDDDDLLWVCGSGYTWRYVVLQ
jgi:hypothetical protein